MTIQSIDDFYDFVKIYSDNQNDLIFRGVRNSKFELISSIGQIKKGGKNLTIDDERMMLNVFKYRGYPFIKEYKDDDLELLSIGQHHGLPTRLLDWTRNPLCAMYFAVEFPFTDDDLKNTEFSCVYIHRVTEPVRLAESFNPFQIDDVRRYVPRHWDKRIVSQGGLFTVHPEPYEPWNPTGLIKILIHNSIRKDIKRILNKLGVNAGTIYPDLDGIVKYIKWLRSDNF